MGISGKMDTLVNEDAARTDAVTVLKRFTGGIYPKIIWVINGSVQVVYVHPAHVSRNHVCE